MAKLAISMPDAMSEYVASRVETGQYGNVSEYFRDLVRREQERKNAADELRQMLVDAEESEVSRKKIPDIVRQVDADIFQLDERHKN